MTHDDLAQDKERQRHYIHMREWGNRLKQSGEMSTQKTRYKKQHETGTFKIKQEKQGITSKFSRPKLYSLSFIHP